MNSDCWIRNPKSCPLNERATSLDGRGRENRTLATCSQGTDAIHYTIPRSLVPTQRIERCWLDFQSSAMTTLAQSANLGGATENRTLRQFLCNRNPLPTASPVNYAGEFHPQNLGDRWETIPQPLVPQTSALPIELRPHLEHSRRFELRSTALQGQASPAMFRVQT